jgi:proteasome lid subunit RPN8/RPN11
MILAVRDEHLKQIGDRAESTYPDECCGLLLGQTNSKGKILIEVWETENVWDEAFAQTFQFDSDEGQSEDLSSFTSERRYTIAPETMLLAQRYARDHQLEIIGIYHSHPDHPAVPSECDRLWAWQQYSYIIASVREGKMVDIQSWQLDGDRQFQPEEILKNL